MSSNPDNRSTDRLPVLIYAVLAGFVLWMVLAAWGFAGPGYADVTLTVVTGFILVAMAIPFILWRVARANAAAVGMTAFAIVFHYAAVHASV